MGFLPIVDGFTVSLVEGKFATGPMSPPDRGTETSDGLPPTSRRLLVAKRDQRAMPNKDFVLNPPNCANQKNQNNLVGNPRETNPDYLGYVTVCTHPGIPSADQQDVISQVEPLSVWYASSVLNRISRLQTSRSSSNVIGDQNYEVIVSATNFNQDL